ncbi:MAG: PHP domain-containing protein [Bradymonadales bacterium]|nr:PHP domain-containing protein [Bradymonadales bacterium]
MLVDLHAVTRMGPPPGHDPRKIIQAARRSGLDGIAFVDRLMSSHALQLVETGRQEGFPVFIGVEIPANIGRFLCFPPEIDPFLSREEWRQLMAVPVRPTYERVRDLFHSMGGAVLAAHPFTRVDGTRLGDRLAMCEGLDGVEVLIPSGGEIDCLLAVELAVKMGLPLVGGSDGLQDWSAVGQNATLFADSIESQADLVRALKEGNFWAVRLHDFEGRRSMTRAHEGGGRRGSRQRQGAPSSGDQRRPPRGPSDRRGPPQRRRGDGRRRKSEGS